MENIFKICLFFLILSFHSCITTKAADGNDGKNGKNAVQTLNAEKMKEQGFSKGVITTNKSEGCPYILIIDTYQDKLDPINIQDFFNSDMPKNVWVKFGNMRMKNRCSDARPVSIIEIKRREG